MVAKLRAHKTDENHLLLVTNMADAAASGEVELDLGELDVPNAAAIQPLSIQGTFGGAEVDGSKVNLREVPSLQFAALLIG